MNTIETYINHLKQVKKDLTNWDEYDERYLDNLIENYFMLNAKTGEALTSSYELLYDQVTTNPHLF